MKPLSVYIHIPFCVRKCAYCDFNSVSEHTPQLMRRYCGALMEEIETYARRLESRYAVETVYFGGGTPTLLAPSDLDGILSLLRQRFAWRPRPEITIETNPGTSTSQQLRALAAIGVNRLSIGAQSFDDAELRLLGRIHRTADTCRTFESARKAGFANIGLDLIYGLPGQSAAGVARSIDEIARLAPEHVSTYSLTVEKGTPLSRSIAEGILVRPDEKTQAAMFRAVIASLVKRRYRHYEISNFARRGFESRHNSAYWTGADYIGIGAGAHSFLSGRRYMNAVSVRSYIAHNRRRYDRALSGDERLWEKIALGLRLTKGVCLRDSAVRREELSKKAESLVKEGLLTMSHDLLKLTKKGVIFYDRVAVELI
ncbi:MAG TPA: radical SAM family heme chaperone HemW [bacterium]|nr:radical SAM family heme chaperone HemW [bacterium]